MKLTFRNGRVVEAKAPTDEDTDDADTEETEE